MKKTSVLIAMILVVLVAMSTQGLCQEDGINTCYKKVNGQLRVADSCRPPEIPLSLVSREEFEALVARVEALEEAEVVDPCEGQGEDCCTEDAQCSNGSSYCLEVSQCQGILLVGACINNTCDTKPVNYDSACDGLEIDCSPYASVYCTDGVDQSAPLCPTSCASDDDCVVGAICVEGECVL